MYCRYCGKEMVEGAAVCVHCGAPAGAGAAYCPFCGQATAPGAVVCISCGRPLAVAVGVAPGQPQKSKVAAGLMGILLGLFPFTAWGIHDFYLGYTGRAVAQLVLQLLGWILLLCGGVGVFLQIAVCFWSITEGIIILAGGIKKDGRGIPLKD